MRHRISGKQLNRTSSHRKAMRRNMAASLIQHGAIRTTERKAKELRRFVERIITIARQGTLHARRRVLAELGDRAMTDDDGVFMDKSVVQKLFDEVAPMYSDRPGGYTRIIRLDEPRLGDAGQQVILQLIDEGGTETSGGTESSSRRKRRAVKRHEAIAATEQAEQATEDDEPSVEADEPVETDDAKDPAEEQEK